MAKDGQPSPADKARLAKLRRMRKWSMTRSRKRRDAIEKAKQFIEKVRQEG